MQPTVFPLNVRDGDIITLELTAAVAEDSLPDEGWALHKVSIRHNGSPMEVEGDGLLDLALHLLSAHVGTAEPGGDPAHTRRMEHVRAAVDGLLWGARPA